MAEPADIDRVRARIHRQRDRLARTEPVEPAAAEAVADGSTRPLAARKSATSSALALLGRIVAEHPALAVGLGATMLVAGPGRALRIARKGVRGAIILAAAYRSASTVVSMVSSARSVAERGTTSNAADAPEPQDAPFAEPPPHRAGPTPRRPG